MLVLCCNYFLSVIFLTSDLSLIAFSFASGTCHLIRMKHAMDNVIYELNLESFP